MPPGDGHHVPPELRAIHAGGGPVPPGHILTGQVAVTGARPRRVLQVDTLDVALRQDWGRDVIRPLVGPLPLGFHETERTILPLDAEAKTARMPWGRICRSRRSAG